jgi:hypothetical protein
LHFFLFLFVDTLLLILLDVGSKLGNSEQLVSLKISMFYAAHTLPGKRLSTLLSFHRTAVGMPDIARSCYS